MCTPWHVKMHGTDFNYKKAFCYTWQNRDSKGKPILNKKGEVTWHIKVYDIEEYYNMFVQRGVWSTVK